MSLLALIYIIAIVIVWYTFKHPMVPAILAILPFGLLFAIRYPVILCLFFILFTYFRLDEIFPFLKIFHLPLLLGIVISITLFIYFIVDEFEFFWMTELSLYVLFFGIVTVGGLFAISKSIALHEWSMLAKITIYFFSIIYIIRTTDDFKSIIRCFLLGGLFLSLVILSNQGSGLSIVEGSRVAIGTGTVDGMLSDPNEVALILLLPISFSIALILTKEVNKLDFMLAVTTLPVLFLAIIATQSRGGLLGLSAVITIHVYSKIKSKAIFFLLLAGIIVGLYVSMGISDRTIGGSHEVGLDTSATMRIDGWIDATVAALHRPLVGVGIGNFFDSTGKVAHSIWFQVLAETGFIGFTIFVSLIILLLKNCYRAYHRIEEKILDGKMPYISYIYGKAIFAGFAGLCVSGSFLYYAFTWPFYTLIGLLISYKHYASRHVCLSNDENTTELSYIE